MRLKECMKYLSELVMVTAGGAGGRNGPRTSLSLLPLPKAACLLDPLPSSAYSSRETRGSPYLHFLHAGESPRRHVFNQTRPTKHHPERTTKSSQTASPAVLFASNYCDSVCFFHMILIILGDYASLF